MSDWIMLMHPKLHVAKMWESSDQNNVRNTFPRHFGLENTPELLWDLQSFMDYIVNCWLLTLPVSEKKLGNSWLSRNGQEMFFFHVYTYILSGWWFGTFFTFPYVGNNHPNWLVFFQRDWNHQPDYIYIWYFVKAVSLWITHFLANNIHEQSIAPVTSRCVLPTT